jgi:hypothetical protein
MNLILILNILRAAAFIVDALQTILAPETTPDKREALSSLIIDEAPHLEKLLTQLNADGDPIDLASLTTPRAFTITRPPTETA